MTEIA